MAMYRVYSERLVPYGRGWAPWDPSPGVNAETDARNPPVQIGDVGYMLAGQFQRLFNVHLAHDDPAQADDLPDGFEALPLHRARDVQKAKVRPQVFCSQMVSAVGASAGASGTALFAGRLSFSSARTQGAVLAIPDTVHAEQIRNPGAYDRYVETHAERWHALAARRHLGLQMEDLMLVTGRDLTKSWGNAVFCDHSLDGRISLEVDFAPLGGAQVASHIRWTNVQNAMINWGPDPEDEEEEEEAEAAPASDAVEGPSAGAPSSARRRVPLNTRDDQCIFIRHVCAKKRRMFHFPRKMKAAAEPRDPDRGEDFDGDGSVSGIASGPRAWESGHGKSHLLPVLDYILENSDVDIAIAHDGDLLPFLIEEHGIKSAPHKLAQKRPHINRFGKAGRIIADSSTATRHPTKTADSEGLSVKKDRSPVDGDAFTPRRKRVKLDSDASGQTDLVTLSPNASWHRPAFALDRDLSSSACDPKAFYDHAPKIQWPQSLERRIKVSGLSTRTSSAAVQRADIAAAAAAPAGRRRRRRVSAGEVRTRIRSKHEGLVAQILQRDDIIDMLSAQLDGLQVSAASLAAYRTVSPSSRDMDRGKDDAGNISSASPDINSDRTPASTHLADYTVSTQPARSAIPREKKPVGKIVQKDGDAKTPPGKGKRRSSASIKQRVRFDVVVPDIIAHGLVMEDDVEELFEIFYTRINPFVGILDPLLHTPSSLFSRSPCLFNVVCAISIRYSKKANVHSIAMHIAKTAAANTLIDGFKSVELCQAHVLMSMYSEGEDHGWIDAWLALQIAADLKLQQPLALDATSACHERGAINRTRTWRVCRNLDRSMSMFYGKPSANGEDITSHDDPQWYDQSSTNTFESDIRTAALSSLLRILTDFHAEVYEEQVSPQRSKKDMRSLVLQYDKSVVQCHVEWEGRLDDNFDTKVPGAIVRTKLLSLDTNYARLVMFSSALQHGLKHGLQETDRVVFEKGVDAANAVVVVLVDVLAKTGYLRYSPNGHFFFGAFASEFLLKLLQPQCAPLVHEGLRTAIRDTVDRVVNTFGSPLVAVDARHPPKLYSDFLRTLLAKRRRESGRVRDAQPSPPRPLTLPDSSEPESPTRSRSSHGTGSLSEPPDREAVQAHGTPKQARREKTRGQAAVSTPRTPLRLGSGFDFSFNISIA